MNQAEYLGAQLVSEIRLQADALAAWQASTGRINDLYDQIIALGEAEIPRAPAPGEAVTETMLPLRLDRGITCRPVGETTVRMPGRP